MTLEMKRAVGLECFMLNLMTGVSYSEGTNNDEFFKSGSSFLVEAVKCFMSFDPKSNHARRP